MPECHVRAAECHFNVYNMLFYSSPRKIGGAPGAGTYRGRGRGAKRDRLAENGPLPGSHRPQATRRGDTPMQSRLTPALLLRQSCDAQASPRKALIS